MTTKEWLNRGWRIDREIRELERAQKEALNLATRITTGTDGERVGGTKANSSERNMVTYADKVTEYTALINKKIAELVGIKTEILQVIGQIEDSTMRDLLIAKYINSKKWEEIALDLNYCYKHVVHTLHPRALQSVKEVIESNIPTVI